MAKKNNYLATLMAAKAAPVATPIPAAKTNVVPLKQTAKPAFDAFVEYCRVHGISSTGCLADLIAAYSDCNGTESARERSLDYKATTAFDGEGLLRAFEIALPEGYNDCTLKAMEQIVKAFGEDAKYFLGRNGSVELFVIPNMAGGKRLWLNRFSVDELSLEPDGRFRLWFD